MSSKLVSLGDFAATKKSGAEKERSEKIVSVLEELLGQARHGELTGLLFLIEQRGGRQCAGAAGTLMDDPSALALGSARLQRLVGVHLDEIDRPN